MAARRLIFGALAACGSSLAVACVPAGLPSDAKVVEGKQFTLAYRVDPQPVPVGRHFIVDLHVCARDARADVLVVRADATMPAHRHGMNYTPSIKPLAAAQSGGWTHRAEGFLFHMPGAWEFVFDLRAGDLRERLTSDIRAR